MTYFTDLMGTKQLYEPAPDPPHETIPPPKNQRIHLGVFSFREREGKEGHHCLFLRKLCQLGVCSTVQLVCITPRIFKLKSFSQVPLKFSSAQGEPCAHNAGCLQPDALISPEDSGHPPCMHPVCVFSRAPALTHLFFPSNSVIACQSTWVLFDK